MFTQPDYHQTIEGAVFVLESDVRVSSAYTLCHCWSCKIPFSSISIFFFKNKMEVGKPEDDILDSLDDLG